MHRPLSVIFRYVALTSVIWVRKNPKQKFEKLKILNEYSKIIISIFVQKGSNVSALLEHTYQPLGYSELPRKGRIQDRMTRQ